MKLIGNLKKKVENAQNADEARQLIRNAGMELTMKELTQVSGGDNRLFMPSAILRTESVSQSILCSGCCMPCMVTVTTTFFANGTQKTSVQTQGGGGCCPHCGRSISSAYSEANDPSSGSEEL